MLSMLTYTQTGPPSTIPTERKNRSLENWVILGAGEEIHKMTREHLVTPGYEKAPAVRSKMTQEPT